MSTPIAYNGLITCALDVRNLDRALDWYKKALGFDLVYKLDGHGWAEIHSSAAQVSLGLGEAEEVKKGGGATVVFGVQDIAAARSHLESMDVRFDGDTHMIEDMVKLATFYDPDGNALMLAENVKKD